MPILHLSRILSLVTFHLETSTVKHYYAMGHACIYFIKCHAFLMFPVLIQDKSLWRLTVENCDLDVQILPNRTVSWHFISKNMFSIKIKLADKIKDIQFQLWFKYSCTWNTKRIDTVFHRQVIMEIKICKSMIEKWSKWWKHENRDIIGSKTTSEHVGIAVHKTKI